MNVTFTSHVNVVKNILLKNRLPMGIPRYISLTACKHCDEEKKKKRVGLTDPEFEGKKGQLVREIDVHTSKRYMKSEAYKKTYGEDVVWKHYRRNHPKQFALKPRQTCIRGGIISTGSACPVCRDDYLVLDYRNTDLLKQFVSKATGEPIKPMTTGLCMRTHKKLELELTKAQDFGLMQTYIKPMFYNYKHLHKKHFGKEEEPRNETVVDIRHKND